MTDENELRHDLPPAGPDDWEVCPTCQNMDGGCPFCGHGYVPKRGFRWPTRDDKAAADEDSA